MTVKELKEKIKDVPDDYTLELDITGDLDNGGSVRCRKQLSFISIYNIRKKIFLQG